MTAKIGDIVRYLNSTGGGRVVRIKDNIAYVDEDGFETPVLLRECVVVTPAQTAATPAKAAPAPAPVTSKYSAPETPAKLPEIEITGGDVINMALGFEPQDIKSLSHTNFDAYIVNDSNYYLYLTFLTRPNDKPEWTARFADVVEPNMQVLLCEIKPEDLPGMDRVAIQYIAFKRGKEFSLVSPASVELKLDTTKFSRLHCFRPHTYFESPAIVLDIVCDGIPARQHKIDAPALEKAMREKVRADRRPVHKAPVANTKRPEIIEVDLHASELLDSTAGLSNAEILNLQIDRFSEVMDANLRHPGQKIVFIHGKGEGVLRQALMKELNHRYKGHDVQDASFREYGFGATQVTIRKV